MPPFACLPGQAGLRPSIACALLLLTGACATGSSPSFTMAPIFFSETFDGSDAKQPTAPSGNSVVAVADDPGGVAPAPRFLIAGGNALLPAGSTAGGAGIQVAATIPTSLLTAQPGLVLASLGTANGGGLVPPGVVTGGVGLVSSAVGAPIIDGVTSIAAPVVAPLANVATTAVAAISAPLAAPVMAPVMAIVSPVTNPIATQLASKVTAIATPVTAAATTAVLQVVTAAAPAVSAPVVAVSPVAAPVTAATAAVAGSLSPAVATLPVAGQRLAMDQTVLSASLRTEATITPMNDTVAVAIRTCLLGGCR